MHVPCCLRTTRVPPLRLGGGSGDATRTQSFTGFSGLHPSRVLFSLSAPGGDVDVSTCHSGFVFSSFSFASFAPCRQGRPCAGLRVVTTWCPFLSLVTFSECTWLESNMTTPTLVRSCPVYLFWPFIFIVLRSFYSKRMPQTACSWV